MWLEHFLMVDVNESNVYLVACLGTRRAALIDAAAFDKGILAAVRDNGFSVSAILITHDHYDHTGGLADYVAAFPDCEVIAGGPTAGPCDARVVRDGEVLHVGNLTTRVLAMGGHTDDSVAYHFTEIIRAAESASPSPLSASILFSGDALFAGSVGGTAGESNRREELASIRSKVFSLPESTIIYPGHGPATTVGVEKRHNPFF